MSTQRNIVIARSVIDQGLTTTQAAEKFGISRQWVHVLVTRYRAGGSQAMHPGSKAPRRSPQRIPPPLRERIITLRTELTAQGADAGPETIAWHLDQEGLRVPSTSTIRRILHAEALIQPAPRKRPKSSYLRFEADLPNECWQADITHTFLTTGTRIDILDVLDDHSRMLLHIQAAASFSGPMVVEAMNALISRYGPPASTLTDNGLVFTSRLARYRGGHNGFEKLLDAHRIQQKNGAPGHPQTQGKIERFHQTLKRWLAARPTPADLPELQGLLDEFQHWYNTARPHRARGRQTPAAAYAALPKASPETDRDSEWRTRTDKVDKNGKISLRYAGTMRHLGVGRRHIGLAVLLLIHDRDVTVSDAATGEVIACHHIDPARDYQAPLR